MPLTRRPCPPSSWLLSLKMRADAMNTQSGGQGCPFWGALKPSLYVHSSTPIRRILYTVLMEGKTNCGHKLLLMYLLKVFWAFTNTKSLNWAKFNTLEHYNPFFIVFTHTPRVIYLIYTMAVWRSEPPTRKHTHTRTHSNTLPNSGPSEHVWKVNGYL